MRSDRRCASTKARIRSGNACAPGAAIAGVGVEGGTDGRGAGTAVAGSCAFAWTPTDPLMRADQYSCVRTNGTTPAAPASQQSPFFEKQGKNRLDPGAQARVGIAGP